MLWTDHIFITQAAIEGHSAHALNEAVKGGVENPEKLIERVVDQTARELETTAGGFQGRGVGSSIMSAHLQAVFNTGSGRDQMHQGLFVENVIVDDPDRGSENSTVKDWVCARVIQELYRAATFRLDENRLLAARDHWEIETTDRWRTVQGRGLPYIDNPLAAPGAARVKGSGSFDASDLTKTTSAGSFAAGTYHIRICYTSSGFTLADGREKAESAPSQRFDVALDANDRLTVSIARLNPQPPKPGELARSSVLWREPTGWNIYLGSDPDELHLQNVSGPIDIATETFDIDSFTASGTLAGRGQSPDGLVDVMPRAF